MSLSILRNILEKHGAHHRDKEEMLEVMEVLSLFSIPLQRLNHNLYDLLLNSNGNSRIAEQSTHVSLHGASNASNLNQSLLEQLNKNLMDLGLSNAIEEGLLQIVRLEATTSNAHYHDSSASSRLLSNLVRYASSLPKVDESLGSVLCFKLRVIEIIIKGSGINEFIKQTLQGAIHKVMRCIDKGREDGLNILK